MSQRLPHLSQDSAHAQITPHVSLQHPNLSSQTIKHIPKAARLECARALANVLNKIVDNPLSVSEWSHLLYYGKEVLIAPPRAGRRVNLPNMIKKRNACYISRREVTQSDATTKYKPSRTNDDFFSSIIRSKIEDGNIRAAVRILCSDDSIAADNPETLQSLRDKHPSNRENLSAPLDPSSTQALQISENDITKAVRSFPTGSAGGPDGIRPQHIQELINDRIAGPVLLPALTAFINMLLKGECPDEVRRVLFGGRLIALEKKDGGVRPIAIGYTWRRLAAKCANTYATTKLATYLHPIQVGVGVKGGCEATVHAVRRFLQSMPEDHALIKLDFKNAFNCINRSRFLSEVHSIIPEIFHFCYLSYSGSSMLKYNDHIIESMVGVQQGDPLGPLLFNLAIHPLLKSLSCPLDVAYLDDVTLGGNEDSIVNDLTLIREGEKDLGLELNLGKCEIISSNASLMNHPLLSSFRKLDISQGYLLGAPLTAGSAMDKNLSSRVEDLKRASKRLMLVSRHDALTLLRFSLSAPKLMHTMRSSPCYSHPSLHEFDIRLRDCLSMITNINLSDVQWKQASLPVKKGGLGIRLVSQVAPSAFLASAYVTQALQDSILRCNQAQSDPILDHALSFWSSPHNSTAPVGESANIQKNWDAPAVEESYKQIWNVSLMPLIELDFWLCLRLGVAIGYTLFQSLFVAYT